MYRYIGPYLNEFSTKSYSPSFGGNDSFNIFALLLKLTHFFKSSYLSILQAKSSLSSLSPPHYSDIVALFYEKLNIGSQSVLV